MKNQNTENQNDLNDESTGDDVSLESIVNVHPPSQPAAPDLPNSSWGTLQTSGDLSCLSNLCVYPGNSLLSPTKTLGCNNALGSNTSALPARSSSFSPTKPTMTARTLPVRSCSFSLTKATMNMNGHVLMPTSSTHSVSSDVLGPVRSTHSVSSNVPSPAKSMHSVSSGVLSPMRSPHSIRSSPSLQGGLSDHSRTGYFPMSNLSLHCPFLPNKPSKFLSMYHGFDCDTSDASITSWAEWSVGGEDIEFFESDAPLLLTRHQKDDVEGPDL